MFPRSLLILFHSEIKWHGKWLISLFLHLQLSSLERPKQEEEKGDRGTGRVEAGINPFHASREFYLVLQVVQNQKVMMMAAEDDLGVHRQWANSSWTAHLDTL